MAQKILSFCCLFCKIVQSVAKKINTKIVVTMCERPFFVYYFRRVNTLFYITNLSRLVDLFRIYTCVLLMDVSRVS